jgi:hypothetical protein
MRSRVERARLASGEVEEVLPSDAADMLEGAKLITPDAKLRLEVAKPKAGRDAQVNGALDNGAFGLDRPWRRPRPPRQRGATRPAMARYIGGATRRFREMVE